MARKQRLLGVEQVQRAFRRLPQVSLNKIAHALNLSADELVRDAKLAAAVSDPLAGQEHYKDTIRNTGIKFKAAAGRLSDRVSVAVVAGDSKETTEAAWRAEFGRKPGPAPLGGGKGHPGHDPQPAMLPAYFATRKRIRGRVQRALRAAAKEVFAGLK